MLIDDELKELMNRAGVGSYSEKLAVCKVLEELDLVSLESKQTRFRRPYFEYSSTELFDRLMSGDYGSEDEECEFKFKSESESECECECECECRCRCSCGE